MKTIREWLETLPEPYRTQALNNADLNDIDTAEPNLKLALVRSFVWKDTPEGYEYWDSLTKSLE